MPDSTNWWKSKSIRTPLPISLLSFLKMLHRRHGGPLYCTIRPHYFDMASSLLFLFFWIGLHFCLSRPWTIVFFNGGNVTTSKAGGNSHASVTTSWKRLPDSVDPSYTWQERKGRLGSIADGARGNCAIFCQMFRFRWRGWFMISIVDRVYVLPCLLFCCSKILSIAARVNRGYLFLSVNNTSIDALEN